MGRGGFRAIGWMGLGVVEWWSGRELLGIFEVVSVGVIWWFASSVLLFKESVGRKMVFIERLFNVLLTYWTGSRVVNGRV